MEQRMIFLASPYSHPSAAVRYARFHAAATMTGYLMKALQVSVFSPISHSHPIFERVPETGDSWQEWAAMNDEMIDFCDEVYVLGIEGWGESKGVAHEIAYARKQGKAVRLVTPLNGELIIGELVEEAE